MVQASPRPCHARVGLFGSLCGWAPAIPGTHFCERHKDQEAAFLAERRRQARITRRTRIILAVGAVLFLASLLPNFLPAMSALGDVLGIH